MKKLHKFMANFMMYPCDYTNVDKRKRERRGEGRGLNKTPALWVSLTQDQKWNPKDSFLTCDAVG